MNTGGNNSNKRGKGTNLYRKYQNVQEEETMCKDEIKTMLDKINNALTWDCVIDELNAIAADLGDEMESKWRNANSENFESVAFEMIDMEREWLNKW